MVLSPVAEAELVSVVTSVVMSVVTGASVVVVAVTEPAAQSAMAVAARKRIFTRSSVRARLGEEEKGVGV